MSPPEEPALSEQERRLMAVLLAGADPGCAESAAVNDEETRPARARTGVVQSAWQPVREQIRAEGGQFEELIDGSPAIQRPQGELAPDPAARAARAALSLQPLLEHRSMALALGQIEGQAPLLLGEMLERAAHLLAHPAASTGVVTDELTAALFDAQPEVEAREGALVYKRAPEAVLPAERRLLGKSIDCVGRERELGMLQGLFEACVAEGHAGAVVITAPPGMGKSRLVHELVQRLRGRGREMVVWIGRGDALRAGSPLGLLRDALQGACGIREGDPPETRRARLVEHVAAHVAVPERGRVSERLGELLGLPTAGEDSALRGAARQDARILGEPLRAAWLDFLRAESAAHPVLLVLEDLHWGDLPTVRLVEAALCALGERPWMVLGLGRPELLERFPRLWAGHGAQHIDLGPLSRRAAMALVRRALGAEVADETAERLTVRSGGQAFFLEELIRAAARDERAALPETVMALVQARLGALPAEERHVLRAASVLGEVFWQGGVTTLLEGATTVAEVEALLARLEERELVVRHAESRLAGEVEFAFRHALVREEAYALLEAEELAAGHRQAACFLERMGERDPLLLARHWERGGVPERAAEHHVVARERARACGDPSDPALTPG